jgi:hypothetical protein
MAKMIPDVPEDSIENSGEREAYRQLRDQLPRNWVVRHHYPTCWMNGSRLLEREGDFIVLAPGKGIMFIEVKGSHGYASEAGIWYRLKADGSREPADNPFDQVQSFKHHMIKQLCSDVFRCEKASFPGAFGHVVMYPKGKVEGSLPSSKDPMIMVAYRDMSNLRERLEASFMAWDNGLKGTLFTPEVMSRVEKFLTDDCKFVPVLAALVDDDERRIRELTERQYAALRGILSQPRVHVRGTAGSGKTILAGWTAQAFADKGQRTLLVCFNRVLAAWLRHRQGSSPAFDIRSFFSLCREVVVGAGLPFNVPASEADQKHFWSTEAPLLFGSAIDHYAEQQLVRYDAIIVDEAQDFHHDWWLPLQLMLRDPDRDRLCLFSDPEQAGVYGQGTLYPDGLVSYELLENCRNTKRITSYCGNVINRQVTPFSSSPEGVNPVILDAQPSPAERAERVRKLVIDLMAQEISPSRIAILSPWKKGSPNSTLHYISRIHNKPLQGDEDAISKWQTNQVVWASTIKAFKGMEADFIVVTDVPEIDTQLFNLADLYVAASRAKHHLYFVPTSPQIASGLQEWSRLPAARA